MDGWMERASERPARGSIKALSARVVRAAPDDVDADRMRAHVLSGIPGHAPWVVGLRSAAELRDAAARALRAGGGALWCAVLRR